MAKKVHARKPGSTILPGGRPDRETLCGERARSAGKVTDDSARVTCKDCRKKLGLREHSVNEPRPSGDAQLRMHMWQPLGVAR